MNRDTKKNNVIKSENGAVIVFVAIFLVILAAFTALVIDVMQMASFRQESQNNAGFAAISALEEFMAAPVGQKFQQAAARANAVGGFNLAVKTQAAETVAQGGTPNLEFGIWYYTNPTDDSTPCAVSSSSSQVPPCFVPTGIESEINAVRISGNYYKGLNLPFASASFGISTFKASVNAIASVVPMQGVALFDLSRSMVKETHDIMKDGVGATILRSDGKAARHRYGYYLAAPNGLPGTSSQDPDWDALVTNFPARASGAASTSHYVSDYQDSGGAYNDVTLLGDTNYGDAYRDNHPDPAQYPQFSTQPAVYRMDGYSESTSGGYGGPEPYTTMLKALRGIITRLRDRKITGSKFGIIFYDQRMTWTRTFSLTDDFDYLLRFLDPLDPASKALRYQHDIFPNEQANTNTPLALTEAARQLFNSSESGIPASKFVVLMGDGMTNCPSCNSLLNPALDTNPNGKMDYVDTRNFSVCQQAGWFKLVCVDNPGSYWLSAPLCSDIRARGAAAACKFTDLDGDGVYGIANSGYDSGDWDLFNKAIQQNAYCLNGVSTCGDNFDSYSASMLTVKDIVRTSFAPSKTPVHIMPIGKSILPASRDIADPNNPGECLSPRDARAEEGNNVKLSGTIGKYDYFLRPNGKTYAYNSYYCTWTSSGGGRYNVNDPLLLNCSSDAREHYLNQTEADPFLPVQMDLYDIARMTGGVWAPIRPFQPGCTIRGCQPCSNCNSYQYITPSASYATMDPMCENTEAQVERYIDEIFGVNPFGLVVENPL